MNKNWWFISPSQPFNTMPTTEEKEKPTPKPRPIKLEAHILAYLGDFLYTFEESVKRRVINIQKPPSLSPDAQ